MSSEEAKRLINDGLQLRRQRRETAEREAQLEAYEKEMIAVCNENCADAKKHRQMVAAYSYEQALEAAHKREIKANLAEIRKREREELQKKWIRDSNAFEALKQYAFSCLAVMMATAWTPFPLWAAAALTFGLAICLAAYIFRLYFPI